MSEILVNILISSKLLNLVDSIRNNCLKGNLGLVGEIGTFEISRIVQFGIQNIRICIGVE